MGIRLTAVCGLALAACSAEGSSAGSETVRVAPCGVALAAEPHPESFTAAGRDASPERLARLTRASAEAFAAAADAACASGALAAAQLRDYDRLLVQNGEGATEPVLYEEPLEWPRTLVLQYLYDAEAPPAAEYGPAIHCWRNPEAEDCYQD